MGIPEVTYCGISFTDIYTFEYLIPKIKELLLSEFPEIKENLYYKMRKLISEPKIKMTRGKLTIMLYVKNMKIGVNVKEMKGDQTLKEFDSYVRSQLEDFGIDTEGFRMVFFT